MRGGLRHGVIGVIGDGGEEEGSSAAVVTNGEGAICKLEMCSISIGICTFCTADCVEDRSWTSSSSSSSLGMTLSRLPEAEAKAARFIAAARLFICSLSSSSRW